MKSFVRSLLLCCVSLMSCTPIAVGPPPTKIPMGSTQEIGVQHSTALQVEGNEINQIFLEEAIWYRKKLNSNSELQLAGGAFWNGTPIFYGFMGYRRYFTLADGGEFGIDVKVGPPFYAEVGIPLQQQIGDKPFWITTHPSAGLNAFGALHIPLGISWQPKEKIHCNTSIGSRFIGDNPSLFYWNAGISFPF